MISWTGGYTAAVQFKFCNGFADWVRKAVGLLGIWFTWRAMAPRPVVSHHFWRTAIYIYIYKFCLGSLRVAHQNLAKCFCWLQGWLAIVRTFACAWLLWDFERLGPLAWWSRSPNSTQCGSYAPRCRKLWKDMWGRECRSGQTWRLHGGAMESMLTWARELLSM